MKHKLINTAIDRAVEIMRYDPGCTGIPEYVEHLSWLFFLKFIDDRTTSLNAQAQSSDKLYKNDLSDEYQWSTWVPKVLGTKNTTQLQETGQAADPCILFVREQLFPYLASLSGEPKLEMISKIFRERTPPICSSPDRFRQILAIVDSLSDPDSGDDCFISAVYSNLLSKLRPWHMAATGYYTPDAVVRFIVETLSPEIGETVYDPACGSGALLIAAYEHMKTRVLRPEDDLLIQRSIRGREIASLPLRLCYMQTLLKGMENSNISCYDSLKSLEDGSPQFDIILTNPPFGKFKFPSTRKKGEIQPSQLEDSALEYAMRKLQRRKGARCGIIVSEGFLFREAQTVATRQQLLDNYNLFMLVKLPAGVFGPYSSVSTSILFFEWPGPTREVLYYKLPSQEGRKVGKTELALEKHLSEALEVFQTWNEYRRGEKAPPKQTTTTWIEPVARIKERNYSLMAYPPNDVLLEPQVNASDLLVSLLDRTYQLNLILERLHTSLSNKERR